MKALGILLGLVFVVAMAIWLFGCASLSPLEPALDHGTVDKRPVWRLWLEQDQQVGLCQFDNGIVRVSRMGLEEDRETVWCDEVL
jgi:hypothetical protein